MYIVLSLPNGTTLNTDIVRSSYQYTECLYNDLSPVDNSVKCTVPYSVDLTNALQGYINDYIAATLKDDDGTAIFTGYVRKQASMSKTTKNNDIAIELVPSSVLLNENYGQNTSFINRSMSTVIASLISTKLPNSTVINCPDVTVQICKVEESDNVKTVITDLLFERGYTWTFNAAGVFTCVKLFGMQPSTIGQTFSDGQSGNMYGTYNQDVKERQYDSICAEFKEIAYKENQVIFDDQSGKELAGGAYLFGNSNGEYITYDCDGVQSVEYIESASISITATGTYTHSFQNFYTKGKLIVHNTSTSNNTITNIKVTGSGYFVTATSKAKTTAGKKEKSYKVKYLFDRSLIEVLVKDINDYYRYSATKLTLKSSSDFALGSYCNVVAEGAGQYTARVIRKTHTATSDLITYELESVSSYTPAVVTTEATHESYTVPVTSVGASIPAIRLSTHAVSSFPAVITASCISSDGSNDRPFTAYIAVYIDDSTVPVYRSENPEQSISYTVPAGTETAVFRMETKDGSLYDTEKVIVIPQSGDIAVLDNGFQLFEPSGHGFAVSAKAYHDGEEVDAIIRGVSEGSGLSVTLSENTAFFVPTGTVQSNGEVNVDVGIPAYTPEVIGITSGDTTYVIGIGNNIIGFDGQARKNQKFKFNNYDIASVQPAIDEVKNETSEIVRTELIRNAYIGSISNPSFIPTTVNIGDYWLCSGVISGYEKGTIYICTGFNNGTPTWQEDSNVSHQQTAMADTLAILDSIGEENLSNLFVKNLVASTTFINKLIANTAFIDNLFAEVIKIKTGGSISSNNYTGVIDENGHISQTGDVGFALGSDGSADFVNMHATNSSFKGEVIATSGSFSGSIHSTGAYISGNSTFEGDIYSGPLTLSSSSSEGATLSGTNGSNTDYSHEGFNSTLYATLSGYSLISSQSGNNSSGNYTSKLVTGISPTNYSYIYCSWSQKSAYRYNRSVVLYDSAWNVVYSTAALITLTFKAVNTGTKTFKLTNLPTSPSSTAGVVWTNGSDGILRIS